MINLESISIDIEDLIDELESLWLENPDSKYNNTAFSKVKDSGDNLQCCCPFHLESNPSFGILKEFPYVWSCFGCGETGNLGSLISHVMMLPTPAHGENYLLKQYGVMEKEKRPKMNLEDILDGKKKDRRCSKDDSELQKYLGFDIPYMRGRGFSKNTLEKYEIGYDKNRQEIIIPIRASNGQIRFLKRRSIITKTFLNEKNIDKRDIVYGLHYLSRSGKEVPEIYLTESETDAMSLYQCKLPAGSIIGRILFKEQAMELLKAGVKRVHLFFDNDLAGLRCTQQAYNLLSKYPIRINQVIYPDGMLGLDTWSEDEIFFKDANSLLVAGKLNKIKSVPFEFSGVKWEKLKGENNGI
jgi:DNA primase